MTGTLHPSDNGKLHIEEVLLLLLKSTVPPLTGTVVSCYCMSYLCSQYRAMLCVAEPLMQITLAYTGLNIADSLNLLLCASHHLTQLSDRFVRVLVAVVSQLALMLNVHILFSCGPCMPGIRSGAKAVDHHLLPLCLGVMSVWWLI